MHFLEACACFIFSQILPYPNFPLHLFTEITHSPNYILSSVNSPSESTDLHTVPLGFRMVQH